MRDFLKDEYCKPKLVWCQTVRKWVLGPENFLCKDGLCKHFEESQQLDVALRKAEKAHEVWMDFPFESVSSKKAYEEQEILWKEYFDMRQRILGF